MSLQKKLKACGLTVLAAGAIAGTTILLPYTATKVLLEGSSVDCVKVEQSYNNLNEEDRNGFIDLFNGFYGLRKALENHLDEYCSD